MSGFTSGLIAVLLGYIAGMVTFIYIKVSK